MARGTAMAAALLLTGLAGCAAPPVDASKIPVAKFVSEVSSQVDLFQGWIAYLHDTQHDKPVGVCLSSIDFSLSTSMATGAGGSLNLAAAPATGLFGLSRTTSNKTNFQVTYDADYSQTPAHPLRAKVELTEDGGLPKEIVERNQFAAALFALRSGLQKGRYQPKSGPGFRASSVKSVFTVTAELVGKSEINLLLFPVSTNASLTQSDENVATVIFDDQPGADGLCHGDAPAGKKGTPAAVFSRFDPAMLGEPRSLMDPGGP